MENLNDRFAMHYGSEQMFFDPLFPGHIYTEGVKHVVEELQCHWLRDIIFSRQSEAKGEHFQVWKATSKDNKADIELSDGNENVIWTKHISYTDLPEGVLTMWYIVDDYINEQDERVVRRTLLLPSEY